MDARALVRLDAWTAAPRMFVFDPAKKSVEPTPLLPPSPVVFKDIVATETKAKSADGTLVPLSILICQGETRGSVMPVVSRTEGCR